MAIRRFLTTWRCYAGGTTTACMKRVGDWSGALAASWSRLRPSAGVWDPGASVWRLFARRAVHQRSRRGQQLARFEQCLQAGEDHRPTAVELVVGALAKLVVGDGQVARVADRFDLPGHPRG